MSNLTDGRFETTGYNFDQSHFPALKPRITSTSSEVAESNGASWKIKGLDTKIACLLCMLLAVMHQSISQPYYYSDYTQHTHTIQMRG